MITEKEIFDKIEGLRQKEKVNKFIGAITVEIIREELTKEGFNLSPRDSFVKGIPNEIDLIILKKEAKPIITSYYSPEDVIAVMELKFRGIYAESDLLHIKKMFDNTRKINPSISCIYLTMYENKRHPHRATKENLTGEVFELFSPETNMNSAIKKNIFYASSTGDWTRLISFLKTL